MFARGEIQKYLDGPTGNPKKDINYNLSLLTHGLGNGFEL
jgi:hypothetical protein